jgi:ABC-type transport system substrate-binding protein
VLVRFNQGPDAIEADVLRGEIDVATGSPQLPQLLGDDLVERTPGLATWYVGFVTDATPFEDVRVRRAFAHALDRERFAGEARLAGRPATHGGFLPPAMPGHTHRIGLEHDPVRALELLADSGHGGGANLPEIVLAAPWLEWAEPVAAQWREVLGVRVRLVLLDPPGRDPRTTGEPVNCWFLGHGADFADPAGYLVPALRASAGQYAALHRDDGLLELLRRVERTQDRDVRLELVHEFERRWITEQVAITPLLYSEWLTIRQPWVEGYWATPVLPCSPSQLHVRRH